MREEVAGFVIQVEELAIGCGRNNESDSKQ